MQRKLRTFLDALHGSKWARIIPLGLIGVIYAVSMIVWQPANIADWFKPLFINVMAACGMYFVNRFSSGTWEFNNIGVLFFSVFSAFLCRFAHLVKGFCGLVYRCFGVCGLNTGII